MSENKDVIIIIIVNCKTIQGWLCQNPVVDQYSTMFSFKWRENLGSCSTESMGWFPWAGSYEFTKHVSPFICLNVFNVLVNNYGHVKTVI